MKSYLLFPILIFLVIACDEAEDPTFQVGPPRIKVDFIPDTTYSLNTLRLAETSNAVDSLFNLRDSLIEEGNPDTVIVIEEYEKQLEIEDSLEVIDGQFRSGRVRINDFIPVNGQFVEELQDTVNSVFSLPLNLNDTISTFVFGYYDLQDTISFRYKTNTTYKLDKIIIEAFELDVVTHTFDSLSRHFCQTEDCRSSEITYKVYF